jgi:AhpD family alkylhydroperoxidase
MGKDIPDTVRSFLALFEKTTQPGALDTKQKELIALGIAVAQHCVPCIYIHTQKAVEAGATRKEAMEAAAVAVLMGGGPAYTHVPEVVKTLDALGAS